MIINEIAVGGRFCCRDTGRVYTRVTPQFWLPSKEKWLTGAFVGVPSREHILAVDECFRLTALRPDMRVEPL